MPVEIKELIIRAVAEPGGAGGEAEREAAEPDRERQAIVEACVKQVLRILKRSRER